MNRKVLLIEPDYRNKYPPMGLMKIATYYRMVGDDVRFYKGDLRILAAEIVADQLIEKLNGIGSGQCNWKKYKATFIDFFRHNRKSIIEDYEDLTSNPFIYTAIMDAKKDYKNKSYFTHPIYDKVGVTTLFTFYWKKTIDTINFVKQLCKRPEDVMVGGIMASLLPDEVYKATGIHPFVGQLNHPGDIDEGNNLIIDELPLDYSILEEIDYKYPAKDAYFSYMTRGCINKCAFCAVPKLEPKYCSHIGIKDQLKITDARFGPQKDLLLLDNNVLASKDYYRIIDEIKECGFAKGATYFAPNQYTIAIRNIKDHYNDRAYIRKTIGLYRKLMDRLPEEENKKFYMRLEEHECLDVNTATCEAIIDLDEYVAPLYEKYFKYHVKRKRIVDFNQGIDARLVTDEKMRKLSEINIEPLRIAFDHWEQADVYETAVRTATKHGIKKLSNYLLYNFLDKPEHLYFRLRLNVYLCEELDADIYSFPMKYHPINDPKYFMNRDYIGKYWNKKFIRAVQAVLNSTKGKIGRGIDFFDEAFGATEERFNTILWMPETFIIYRMKYKDNEALKWENAFYSLSEQDLNTVKSIVAMNKFDHMNFENYSPEVGYVLSFYTITRDDAERNNN